MNHYINLIFSINFLIESIKVIFYTLGIVAFIKYIKK